MSFQPAAGGSSSTTISGQPVRVSGQTVFLPTSTEIIAHISGQTVIASVTTNISGQVVIAEISGQPVLSSVSGNVVRISGSVKVSGESIRVYAYDASGDTFNPLRIDVSGGHRLQVQAQTSVSGQTVRISGETLSLPATQEIVARVSGQEVVLPPATMSGLTVLSRISGQVVRMSGETVSLPANTSVIAKVSGEAILISGQTVLVPLTSISGNVVNISGQTVNASVTTNISGQVVYLVSGNNDVQISGQSVITSVSGNMVSISGQPVVASVTTNISGQTVVAEVSGQVVNASGNAIRIGDNVGSSIANVLALNADGRGAANIGLVGASWIHGYDSTVGTWSRVRVTSSGQGVSGQVHRLVVALSGDPVSVSGQAVSTSGNVAAISGQAVLISGQTVVASVTTNISGQTVYTASGSNAVQISGQAVSVSGNIVQLSGGVSVSGSIVYFTSGRNEVLMGAAPTYHIWTEGQLLTSGATLLAGHYVSGTPIIKVKKLFLQNLNAQTMASGQTVKFDLIRSIAAPTGGTALVALPSDPTDPVSGVSVTWQTKNTNDLFTSGRKFFSWMTNNQTTVPSSGTNAQLPMSQLAARLEASVNLLAESPELKELRLTSGYGFCIKQSTSGSAAAVYSQAVSGVYGVYAAYTVE